jgi:hypothetical protein
MKNRTSPPAAPPSFYASLERLLGKNGNGMARLVVASAFVASSGPLAAGCAPEGAGDDGDTAGRGESLVGQGQSDWAQLEGRRDTALVSYYGENWHHFTDCNTRAGCQGVDLFLKVRVRPVAGANVEQKRVGVIYRAPGTSAPVTVLGNYFTTWANGDEEWHVKVHLRSSEDVVSFNAWYQDGLGNTLYDDNAGKLHALAVTGTHAAVLQLWNLRTLRLDGDRARGKIAVRLADLDFDKEVRMAYTTDGWKTVNWAESGEGANHWHWAQDYGADYEQWEIDVDVAAPGAQQFEYAILYRHAAGGDQAYEFWDNNFGQNYRVERQP